jgi:hypothetical protein
MADSFDLVIRAEIPALYWAETRTEDGMDGSFHILLG